MQLLFAVTALFAMPAATPAATPPDPGTIRGARVTDQVVHPEAKQESWTVWGFDPSSKRYLRIRLDRGNTRIHVQLFAPPNGRDVHVIGQFLLERTGNGVWLTDGSIEYGQGTAVVTLATNQVRGRLVLRGRPGVTAGPWRLGAVDRYTAPGTRPGWMRWSVPFATGTLDGSLDFGDLNVTVRGWRAFHDHTWGYFNFEQPSYNHWTTAAWLRSRTETWILQGLERQSGTKHRFEPSNESWRGILVHVTPRGTTACRATVRRTGWERVKASGEPWPYVLPNSVRASCGGNTVTFAMGKGRGFFTDWSAYLHALGALASGPGFFEHVVPSGP